MELHVFASEGQFCVTTVDFVWSCWIVLVTHQLSPIDSWVRASWLGSCKHSYTASRTVSLIHCTGCSRKKTAQSLQHHNFATADQSHAVFSEMFRKKLLTCQRRASKYGNYIFFDLHLASALHLYSL